jgi:hypothetical protein
MSGASAFCNQVSVAFITFALIEWLAVNFNKKQNVRGLKLQGSGHWPLPSLCEYGRVRHSISYPPSSKNPTHCWLPAHWP